MISDCRVVSVCVIIVDTKCNFQLIIIIIIILMCLFLHCFVVYPCVIFCLLLYLYTDMIMS